MLTCSLLFLRKHERNLRGRSTSTRSVGNTESTGSLMVEMLIWGLSSLTLYKTHSLVRMERYGRMLGPTRTYHP